MAHSQTLGFGDGAVRGSAAPRHRGTAAPRRITLRDFLANRRFQQLLVGTAGGWFLSDRGSSA
jgi:hypothetical protein